MITNSEFFDMTEEMEWNPVDADCFSYDMKAPTEKFTIWMDEINDKMYLVVSGKLNANGTWTLRCRKARLKHDTHPVKNIVSELTVQALNDVIKDWFESNKDTEDMKYDDWDTGDKYL